MDEPDRSPLAVVGAKRIQVDPGMWSTPLHLEGAEEEIFYVLGGSGVSVQWEGEDDPFGYEVRAGDCIVHLALENAHTLRAGPDGLDVLAFGQRSPAAGITWLPRAGVAWLGETWAPVGAEEDHPWAREAAAGPPEVGRDLAAPVEHRERRRDRAGRARRTQTIGRRVGRLGAAAGSQRTGLRYCEVLPGHAERPAALPRRSRRRSSSCSRATASCSCGRRTASRSTTCVPGRCPAAAGHGRRPHVPGRRGRPDPPMYGPREPGEVCFYPRSRKVYFIGLGLVTRVGEQLDYWEGED